MTPTHHAAAVWAGLVGAMQWSCTLQHTACPCWYVMRLVLLAPIPAADAYASILLSAQCTAAAAGTRPTRVVSLQLRLLLPQLPLLSCACLSRPQTPAAALLLPLLLRRPFRSTAWHWRIDLLVHCCRKHTRLCLPCLFLLLASQLFVCMQRPPSKAPLPYLSICS
jgi:hypothetical protein